MNRRDRRAAGRKPNENPGGSGLDTAAASCAAGLQHLQAGRYLDAQICCQQALSINPDHADALHLMGLLSLQSQQYDHAAEWIGRAIGQKPRPEYLPSLAAALQGQGRLEEAVKAIDEATQLKPDDAGLWTSRGNILTEQGRLAEALPSFEHALKLDPRHWGAADRSAFTLCTLGRFDEALKQFNLCDELQPNHAPTLCMRALSLRGLKRFEEALADNERAYVLDPTIVENCNNAGDALQSLGRYEESLKWFERALKFQPDRVEVLNNKAHSLGQLHRFGEALVTYDHLRRVSANTALADWNAALLHLLTGNFEAGWAGREARWKVPVPGITYPKISGPKWLGQENIEGKTILIGADEGLGDSIQFARYVPMVAARGARVVLLVAKPVCSLLSDLPGVSLCLPASTGSLPAFDMHCPMSSLPLAFGTRLDTIPPGTSYLPSAAASRVKAWEDRLGTRNRLRVGLVWSGNPVHANDHNRSTSLRLLARILDADATFVSLQKDPKPDDKAFLRERPDIIDLTADLNDFSETAALVSCLDLVITVDTSVAHLAAALGRPTWILLPHTPDYRWLLDREDSPWYPTVRLFRQTETRDYAPVLDRVRSELRKLIAATPQRRDAGTPASLYEAGLGHMQAGRYRDAQVCGEQALAIDPDHPDSLHLMGLLSHQAKQYDRAAEWIARAAEQAPKPEYLSNLGATLRQLGRHEEACQAFDKATRLKPDDAALWKSLGNVQGHLARSAEAVSSFQQVLRLKPDDWDAANICGMLLDQLGRLEEALSYFSLCDELRPNDRQTLNRRAMCLCGLKRFEQALGDLERTHALDPNDIETVNNIGVALQSQGRDEDALEWFDKTLARQPALVDVLTNKMIALGRLHRFGEAIATYHRVKAVDPDNATAELWLGHLHLLRGNFEAGWAGLEARLRTGSEAVTKYPQPQWLGEGSIEGKVLLVYSDEGLGDTIQYARYLPMLAARAARVILLVQSAAQVLLSKLPGIAQCFSHGVTTLPAFDLHCPISSLPLAFGTRLDTIPSGASYLPSPPASLVQAFEDRLGPRNKLRVGLVWSGNPDHDNDHNRSISLRALSRVIDADATFVSLQKDPRPHDKATLREWPGIIDLTADLTDFVATAALLSCLDLVITVDTSVAHLAGALGCPTWILLPYFPDYRWLLDRDDSPWYPTMRLFRQTRPREYDSVLDRVRNELQILIAERYCTAPGEEHPALISTLAATTADALCDAGFHHLRSGQDPEARSCVEQALAVDSGHADSLHLMGLLSLRSQQYDHAVEWIARAIRQNPKPEYLSSLGTALRHQGRHEEALKAYDKAVQIKPDDADLWQNLGEVLFTLKRPADALLSFQHALTLDPRHWGAMHNSGLLLHQQGRFEEALKHFDLCDELRPDNIATLRMRAVLLRELKRFEESLSADRQLYALSPGDIETCHNIGAALRVLGRYEEALEWFDRSLLLQPNLIQALNNKASSLAQLQRFDEAFAVYDHTKALGLNNALTDWNLALLHMLTGNFEVGWAGREARWHIPAFAAKYPTVSGPKWLGGEPLNGKTILICVDEGLGDAIQFARYLPMLAARGARIILAVQEPLRALLSAVPGVSQCIPIAPTTSAPPFDFHCPMSSLPLAFGTRLDTIPSDISYLPRPDHARIQAWDARLGSRGRLRVGLVWSGNPDHLNDRHRSIPLQTFSRILHADAAFISLQKDIRPVDRTVLLEQTDIVDLTAHLSDFTETAALVSCLDLVITVDTSVAHLAGALGCPTWILLPHTPDYRWLLDRDDNPWYPTVRLFRQTGTRDYGEVLDRVRDALLTLIAANEQHHWDAAQSSAIILHEQGRLEEAISYLNQCDELQPNHLATLHRRALCLFGLKRFEEGLTDSRRAHALDPGKAYICNNIGGALQSLGRDDEALSWFDRTLALRPDFTPALINKASSLVQLQRFDEAVAICNQVKAFDPDNAAADWNLARVQMLNGNFEAGWSGREARWKIPSFSAAYPDFSEPMWLGQESIEGKTILICSDEGLGDAIQFARYVPMVAARGARVVLVVDEALYPLLSTLSGVSHCLAKSPAIALPAFDMHCPITSLPLAFGTKLDTIPSGAYLPALPAGHVQAWNDRLGPHDRLRVGLVWSGNPKHLNDHNRSLPLQTLSRVLDLGASFVSLQKDLSPTDKAALRERADIIDLTADLTDFAETAALVNCLDLVITVDTSVAHLAGALGCPTWILLPYTPDDRWLLDREDSPWYPTVRLFRQTEARDYDEVLDRVRSELQALIATNVRHPLLHQPEVQLNSPDTLCAAGVRHLEAGRHPEALQSFEQALQLDPRHWDAAHRSGFLLHQLGRPREALSYLNLCDELQPDHSPTLQMRAICLCELKRPDEGLIDIKRAQLLDPTNAGLSDNVGLVLKSLGRDEEALTYFDQAVMHRPDHVAGFINKASSLHRLRRFDEALTIYRHVKTLDPANAEADLGLSFLHLLTGNFEAGWSLREARWNSNARKAAYPKLSTPMWLGGEPVDGKTILVYLDEGLGDTIQFVRYVPMLAARGARVVLVVQDTLHRLLSGLSGVSECLPLSATATLPPFDLHCSIMSLPLAFGTRLETIPQHISYLPAPATGHVEAWEKRLGPRTKLRVGIAWSGNPAHDNDRNRSIPLQTFVRLLDLDATFVSLQKDPKADDQAILLERTDINDLTSQLTDFADTAALICSLDLVVTVDTSVAHLAGALGRPTWILLPYVPDWRWLLDRDDSPWYPTARLFRQTGTRDYDEVLDRVWHALLQLIAAR